MVRLRLRRKGRTHRPFYDIVAVDIRAKRDGGYLDKVGYFDPNKQPSAITLDHAKTIQWLNNGAQPTPTVKNLLSYDGVLLRRHLQFKGATEDIINAEIAKHKQVVADRYVRRAELRKKRKIAKSKAEQEASAEESAE